MCTGGGGMRLGIVFSMSFQQGDVKDGMDLRGGRDIETAG